jgi:hypothetical protein
MDPTHDRTHQAMKKERLNLRLGSRKHRKITAGLKLLFWWTPRRRWLSSDRNGTGQTGIESVWDDLSGACLARQENQMIEASQLENKKGKIT